MGRRYSLFVAVGKRPRLFWASPAAWLEPVDDELLESEFLRGQLIAICPFLRQWKQAPLFAKDACSSSVSLCRQAD